MAFAKVCLCLFSIVISSVLAKHGPTPAPPLAAGYTPSLGTPAPLHLYTPKGRLGFAAPSPAPGVIAPGLPFPPESASPLPPRVPFVTPAPPPAYHAHCDPRAAPYCANVTGLHYCLEDPQYPEYDIKLAISQDNLFDKKYSDVFDQSANDLVESIPSQQEYLFDYTQYSGASKGPSPYDASHWIGPEGYLCPSEVVYAMPKRARNVNGEWRVIVNGVHKHSQTARFETCLFPDSACRLLAPCYQSKCTQKYIYHRMLAFDPCDPYKGLFIDVFRFASACSCHLPQH